MNYKFLQHPDEQHERNAMVKSVIVMCKDKTYLQQSYEIEEEFSNPLLDDEQEQWWTK